MRSLLKLYLCQAEQHPNLASYLASSSDPINAVVPGSGPNKVAGDQAAAERDDMKNYLARWDQTWADATKKANSSNSRCFRTRLGMDKIFNQYTDLTPFVYNSLSKQALIAMNNYWWISWEAIHPIEIRAWIRSY